MIQRADTPEAQNDPWFVIWSIDEDGVMKGFDLELARRVPAAETVAMPILGGAGSLRGIETTMKAPGIIAAASASLFVFKGVYDAVLINYPGRAKKEAIFAGELSGALA